MINKIHVPGIQDHKTKENIFQKRDSTCYMKYQFCWQFKGYIIILASHVSNLLTLTNPGQI